MSKPGCARELFAVERKLNGSWVADRHTFDEEEDAKLEAALGFANVDKRVVRYVPESAQPAERAGEWVTCVPRASVRWFAEQMELALRRNDHKGGWHNDRPGQLSERICQEWAELEEARVSPNLHTADSAQVIREAADVANMAHMVADHYREGGPSLDQGHTLPPPPQPKGKP